MRRGLATLFALALAIPIGMSFPASADAAPGDPRSFDIYAEVKEYGQAVTAVIISVEGTVTQAQVDAMNITVQAKTTRINNNTVIYDGPRTITAKYPNTARSLVASATKPASGAYVIVELLWAYNDTFAQVNGSSAHAYVGNANTGDSLGGNSWPLDLDYTVTVNGTNVTYGTLIQPIVDDFKLVPNPVAGYTAQNYRFYTPPGATGKKLPLVLFNHGGGENYSYSATTGRGNEGQQLAAQEAATAWVTDAPEPAYVLAPQRGTASGAPGYSRDGVIAFIQNLIAQGKVDPNAPAWAIEKYLLHDVNAGTTGTAGGES